MGKLDKIVCMIRCPRLSLLTLETIEVDLDVKILALVLEIDLAATRCADNFTNIYEQLNSREVFICVSCKLFYAEFVQQDLLDVEHITNVDEATVVGRSVVRILQNLITRFVSDLIDR